MDIIIITAIDVYKKHCFPSNLKHVPRKGETIEVLETFQDYF